MFPKSESNARVVLVGLPADVAESLGQIVSKLGAILYIPLCFDIPQSLALLREAAPTLAFVWIGGSSRTSLLDAVKRAEPQVRAVAVSSQLEVEDILSALESGAVDYCTPPFDFAHFQGLLQSTDKIPCCC